MHSGVRVFLFGTEGTGTSSQNKEAAPNLNVGEPLFINFRIIFT